MVRDRRRSITPALYRLWGNSVHRDDALAAHLPHKERLFFRLLIHARIRDFARFRRVSVDRRLATLSIVMIASGKFVLAHIKTVAGSTARSSDPHVDGRPSLEQFEASWLHSYEGWLAARHAWGSCDSVGAPTLSHL